MPRPLVAALIVAALIALIVPASREIIAAMALGSLLIVGNIQLANRQTTQVREDLALAERMHRRMSHLI